MRSYVEIQINGGKACYEAIKRMKKETRDVAIGLIFGLLINLPLGAYYGLKIINSPGTTLPLPTNSGVILKGGSNGEPVFSLSEVGNLTVNTNALIIKPLTFGHRLKPGDILEVDESLNIHPFVFKPYGVGTNAILNFTGTIQVGTNFYRVKELMK